MRLFLIAFVGFWAFIPPASAQYSTCQSVYADSVRNVEVQSRLLTEQSDAYSRHCEANGSLKSSSANVDLTVPVKAINIGFSGGAAEAKQVMQEFCKISSEKLSRMDAMYQLSNTVVVDALTSFNQCIALESKRVQIAHVATDSRSLVVRVGFNPAEQNVTLNSVQYDAGVAKCHTNVDGYGPPTVLSATTGQMKAKGPFSVACERISQLTASGDRKYSRFELLVDTNQGAYSVVMPTEEMLGYDLASENKQKIVAEVQERLRLNDEVGALRARIAGVSAKPHFVVQGEGATVACPQNGGDLAAYVAQSCPGGIVSGQRLINSTGGRRCGYSSHEWACIKFQ